MKTFKSQRGAIDLILIVVVALLVAGLGGYIYYQQRQAQKTYDAAGGVTVAKHAKKAVDPYAGWKTYTSKTEKATFKYPTDWKVGKAVVESNGPGADSVGIISPSGTIKVSWVSLIDGLGGACDDTKALGQEDSCPSVNILTKTAIAGASGLSVIEATITTDGITFKPCLAVADSSDIALGKVGKVRTLGFDEFTGKHNGSVTLGSPTTALFSTGSAYLNGPALTEAAAKAWFAKDEVKTAKLILASLSY